MKVLPFVLILLNGCWKLDNPAVDYSSIPLDNEYVAYETIVVQSVTPSPALVCPDGEFANFYMVYDSAITEPAPVAIVFHSGSFDYVRTPPTTGNPLEGAHYAADNRLTLEWAQNRVFSTLGMWDSNVDPTEVHTGTLPAALANKGVVALYPTNCWGDLWHNHSGQQENAYSEERFYREGRAMATWMYRLIADESFAQSHNVLLPAIDEDQIALIGLGEGGRAIPELMWYLADNSSVDNPVIDAVVFDSTADDLTYYYTHQADYATYNIGLDRIFYNATDNLAFYSMANYYQFAIANSYPIPRKNMLIYSTYDLPSEVTEGVIGYLDAMDREQGEVIEVGAAGHVFSNKDLTLSHDITSFIY